MNNGEDWTDETFRAAEGAVGYEFRDKELLKCAFTQNTYANAMGCGSNERLEFLGDAVIELAVTERLFREDGGSEKELTNLRQRYVSKPALELAAKRAGLMLFLRYSGGKDNLRGKPYSNLFEAIAGAIYLDGGMEEARAFIFRFLEIIEFTNFKSLLQEYVQSRIQTTPSYRTSETADGFVCVVHALGQSAEGRGRNKKSAETAAAEKLYKKLTDEGIDR